MEKLNNERICRFRINNKDKKKLVFLNNCLEKNNTNLGLVITIDNMPIRDIDRYKKYVVKVLNQYGYSDVINATDERFEKNKWKKSILLYDFDSEDVPWRLIDKPKALVALFSKVLPNNNIIILTSTTLLDSVDSFKNSNILNNLPLIPFRGDIDEVKEYRSLVKKYKNNNIEFDINLEEFSKIVNEIKKNDYINNYRLSDFLYDYSTKNYFASENKTININSFDKMLNKDFKEDIPKIDLNSITGLNNVKEEMKKLFCYVDFFKKNNINRDGVYLNMIFLGNPGTGKTMVANIIANKLYELGLIKKNLVVKVIPTDLIGEYVGQTGKKTRNILKEAKGKLLFIDEAYLLCNDKYSGGNNPYMDEAIVELLKYLEDVNNITIFAGYKDEMKKIYKANPGIKSRIYKEILFDDYSINELYKILKEDLREKGFSILKNDQIEIKKYIKSIKNEESFGNARTMKQLSQKMIINHACNCFENSGKDQMIISIKDLPKEGNNKKDKRMGFGE